MELVIFSVSSTIPPILILAWRRPLSLERVIDALRIHSPPLLYVACDGPSDNRPGEAAKVSLRARSFGKVLIGLVKSIIYFLTKILAAAWVLLELLIGSSKMLTRA